MFIANTVLCCILLLTLIFSMRKILYTNKYVKAYSYIYRFINLLDIKYIL